MWLTDVLRRSNRLDLGEGFYALISVEQNQIRKQRKNQAEYTTATSTLKPTRSCFQVVERSGRCPGLHRDLQALSWWEICIPSLGYETLSTYRPNFSARESLHGLTQAISNTCQFMKKNTTMPKLAVKPIGKPNVVAGAVSPATVSKKVFTELWPAQSSGSPRKKNLR